MSTLPLALRMTSSALCSSSPPWRMDRHTMTPRVQAQDIIAKRNMWIVPNTLLRAQEGAKTPVPKDMSHPHGMGRIFIDTLLQAQKGAMTRVHMHMNHLHGTTRSVFDMHRLMIAIDLHLRVIAIAIVQLLRAFDMHQLMIAIDLHLRVIAIAIVQLLRAFDMHRPMIAIAIVQLMIVTDIDMILHQGIKRTVIAVHPLAHRRSPPHTATFRLDQDRQMRRPPMEIHQDPRW